MNRSPHIIIFTFLIISFFAIPVFSEDFTLGVLYFETSPGDSPGLTREDKQSLSMALNEIMIADLSRLSILTLVERERLNEVLEEQRLALTGFIDETTAAEAGELLGARFLMTGSLIFTGNIVTFSTRITDAESGEVVAAASKSGEISRVFTLQEEVLEEVISEWDIPLSRKQWGYLAERKNLTLRVVINLGKAIEASDVGNFEVALTYLSEAVELSPNFKLAGNMLKQVETRFDQYIRSREEELPLELLEKIDLIAAGDEQASQDAQKMYMAFTMPLTMGCSYYGSWTTMDESVRDYFFENNIRNSWGQMGLIEAPADMEEVEVLLGQKIYTAYRILEYLLEKDVPFEGYTNYLHPVEGMTAYFLTIFAAISSVEWTYPPMRNADGDIVVASDQYHDILLRYCDMLLTNFPYSVYATMVTPMMHALISRGN
ncbi:MAG: hypothetical protein JEY99_16020 [Spirochaetales bacterium]|nr:hypothetical protein [Spirochaetales bacterium]